MAVVRVPRRLIGYAFRGGRVVGLESSTFLLEAQEVLLADESPGELQEVIRAVGGIVARNFSLSAFRQNGRIDLRRTNLVLLPAYDTDRCPIDTVAAAIRSLSPHD